MVPLNRCLEHYLEQKENDPGVAPDWLLFHDTDEYIYPVDTNRTILQSLEEHSSTCCVLVSKRVLIQLYPYTSNRKKIESHRGAMCFHGPISQRRGGFKCRTECPWEGTLIGVRTPEF